MIKQFFYIFLIFITACSASEEKVSSHPDPGRMIPDDQITHTYNMPELELLPLEQLRKVFISEDSTFTESDNYLIDSYQITLFNPEFVQSDSLGFVFIHNSSNNTVDLFNQEGDMVQQLGGSGYGPGELHRLVTFHYNQDSERLYLLDEPKVEVFKRGTDNLFEYDTTFYSGYQRSFDICELNERVFISGYGFLKEDYTALQDGDIGVFEVSDFLGPIISFETSDFTYKRTLGYEIPSFSGIGQSSGMVSQSWLHCNRETAVIVSDLYFYPLTIGFHADGSMKWVTKIKDLISPEILETEKDGRPSVSFHSNKWIYHRKSRVGYAPEGYAIMNIYTMLPQEDYSSIDIDKSDFESEYMTYLLNTDDGTLQRIENNNKKIEVIGKGFFVEGDIDLDNYVYDFFYKYY